MAKLNGVEVSGEPQDYFSLWRDGCRLTGGTTLFKVFNYAIRTGENELTGNAVMIMFGPLTQWSEE